MATFQTPVAVANQARSRSVAQYSPNRNRPHSLKRTRTSLEVEIALDTGRTHPSEDLTDT